MQDKQQESDDQVQNLSAKVDHLTSENVKLTADMKILRDEHTEILHSLFNLEKKNQALQQENEVLKNLMHNAESVSKR